MIIFIVLLTCYETTMPAFQSPDIDTANLQAELLSGDPECRVSISREYAKD